MRFLAVLLVIALPSLAALSCNTVVGSESAPLGTDPLPAHAQPEIILAAPGRVEGTSEVIELGTAMDGLVATVEVTEGQLVRAGDVLVRLECGEREAQLRAAQAQLEITILSRHRSIRGSREEERRVAATATRAAEARLRQAARRYERLDELSRGDQIVSRQELDDARSDVEAAEAESANALEQERLVNAPLLPEELARADAEVKLATHRAQDAEARVRKCAVTAPISGMALRIHVHAGELVSQALVRPLVSIADTSRFVVRAELDERDVGSVRVGQGALVTADALGERILEGTVSRVEPMMGRKSIHTGDPAEKSDRDVQEVLVELRGEDAGLVVGLRTTVCFLGPAGG